MLPHLVLSGAELLQQEIMQKFMNIMLYSMQMFIHFESYFNF